MKTTCLILALAASALAQQYDLLLKGGRVIDAKQNLDAIRDVAITQGKIAAIAENIPPAQARQVADVKGLIVAPGLVDMHTHVFASTMDREYIGESGIRPDGFTFRSGVTTVVDAGSSGWKNFEKFKKEVIDHTQIVQTRVLAMLNIIGSGMGGRNDVEQERQRYGPREDGGNGEKT